MSISIEKRRVFSRKNQFHDKYYVVIRYQGPNSWEKDDEGFWTAKRKKYSCGEVHRPETWERAEERLRIIFNRKLQHSLNELEKRKRDYIKEEET